MSEEVSGNVKVLRIALAVLQNSVMGGVIFGWAAISGTILEASTKDGGAELQKDFVHMCFVIAVSFGCLSPFVMGSFAARLGPRITAALSSLLFAGGCFLFAASDKYSFGFFIPAICMISFAGPGIGRSVHYTIESFPGKEKLISSLLGISFHFSFLVFYIINQTWSTSIDNKYNENDNDNDNTTLYNDNENNNEHEHENVHTEICTFSKLFENLGYLAMGFFVLSLLIHGDHDAHFTSSSNPNSADNSPINSRSGSYSEIQMVETGNNNGDSKMPAVAAGGSKNMNMNIDKDTDTASAEDKEQDQNEEREHDDYTASFHHLELQEKLYSPAYVRTLTFFCIASFWVNWVVGTVDTQLGDSLMLALGEHHNVAQHFCLFLWASAACIPLFDRMLRKHGPLVYPASTLLIAFLAILWPILQLFALDDAGDFFHYISFAAYSLLRTLLYCFIFPYLEDIFGTDYYDVLIGVMFAASGALGLLQIPLYHFTVGTCASRTENVLGVINEGLGCDEGHWNYVIMLKVLTGFYFLWFSYVEWVARRHHFIAFMRPGREGEGKGDLGGVDRGKYGAIGAGK